MPIRKDINPAEMKMTDGGNRGYVFKREEPIEGEEIKAQCTWCKKTFLLSFDPKHGGNLDATESHIDETGRHQRRIYRCPSGCKVIEGGVTVDAPVVAHKKPTMKTLAQHEAETEVEATDTKD